MGKTTANPFFGSPFSNMKRTIPTPLVTEPLQPYKAQNEINIFVYFSKLKGKGTCVVEFFAFLIT